MQDRAKRCYIYTRVSTGMQAEEGYSLAEQKLRLEAEAAARGMHVVDIFPEEGASGKNIDGRPQFQEMMRRIETGTENVGYVLVSDLSRFGRNMADTVNAIEDMQEYDTYLISTKEQLDSSDPANKAMLQMFAVWAEMERTRILDRTMAGRRQKARQGGWNGGFAPYGYKLVKDKPTDTGRLEIDETEAPVIREIFRLYTESAMGCRRIANWLNDTGHVKKIRQNGTVDRFSEHFVRTVIENPIYCGKIAFGRRKNEKIKGKRNKYHVVKQSEYDIFDGAHDGIITEEVWLRAMARKQAYGGRKQKVHDLEHEHLLSGIAVCPYCGDRMLPNYNRKAKKDGTHYPTIFYYQCRHNRLKDGHVCEFRRSIRQDSLDAEVEQLIIEALQSPSFIEAMQDRLGTQIDEGEIRSRIKKLEETLHQKEIAKKKLADQIDRLDVTDPHYDAKYDDYQARLDKFYDDIAATEAAITEEKAKLTNVYQAQASTENAVQMLRFVQDHFADVSDHVKKEVYQELLDSVELFPEALPDGRWCKAVHFQFPVMIGGETSKDWYADDLPDGWNLEQHDETVVLMSRVKE